MSKKGSTTRQGDDRLILRKIPIAIIGKRNKLNRPRMDFAELIVPD